MIAFLRIFCLTFVFILINLVLLSASIKYARHKRGLVTSTTTANLNRQNTFNRSLVASLTRQGSVWSSSEWNLTKMTLLIALVYFINMIFWIASYAFSKLYHDEYSIIVTLDLIAINFVQITNFFEIISFFLFNRFFVQTFKKMFFSKRSRIR
jgi:hypothetical protein